MISIITAVHNQLAINKIFLHYIRKYTESEYEIIIIDNNSTDGSREFFEKENVKLIKNTQNFSYPVCQNQGIGIAKYDILVFLNNDIIVSKNWDKRMLEISKKHNLEIFSLCSLDSLETPELTRKIRNRWKAVKNPLLFLFGQRRRNLLLMHKLMYGNWENYTETVFRTKKDFVFEGICGSAVVAVRSGIEKIGLWDETQQAADFDIYLRTKERDVNQGDIISPKVLAGVFVHHFSRLTYKKNISGKIAFADQNRLSSIKEKWGEEKITSFLEGSGMKI
jgi:GT2 family glycosyltransferase